MFNDIPIFLNHEPTPGPVQNENENEKSGSGITVKQLISGIRRMNNPLGNKSGVS